MRHEEPNDHARSSLPMSRHIAEERKLLYSLTKTLASQTHTLPKWPHRNEHTPTQTHEDPYAHPPTHTHTPEASARAGHVSAHVRSGEGRVEHGPTEATPAPTSAAPPHLESGDVRALGHHLYSCVCEFVYG